MDVSKDHKSSVQQDQDFMTASSNLNEETLRIVNQEWYQKSFESAIKFYELDSKLETKDRQDLCIILKRINSVTFVGGWMGFLIGFALPSYMYYHKTKKLNGMQSTISIFSGLMLMVPASFKTNLIAYNRVLKQLNPSNSESDLEERMDNATKLSLQRQYNILKFLGPQQSLEFAGYFDVTCRDSSRLLEDPRVLHKKFLEGKTQARSFMKQRDPIGLYQGVGGDKSAGNERFIQNKDSTIGGGTSSWDRVRQENIGTVVMQENTWAKIHWDQLSDADKKRFASNKYNSSGRNSVETDDKDSLFDVEIEFNEKHK